MRSSATRSAQGLYHVGLKIGDTDDDLREATDRLGNSVSPYWAPATTPSATASTSRSDGNDVELFIDVVGVDWKSDPSLIAARSGPCALRQLEASVSRKRLRHRRQHDDERWPLAPSTLQLRTEPRTTTNPL